MGSLQYQKGKTIAVGAYAMACNEGSDLMPIWKAVVLGGLLVAVAAGRLHSAPADAAGIEFFESKIRPVLSSSCYKCHSANSEKLRGHLQLDSREGMLKGGDSGPAIVPGDPDKSLLVKAIHREDPDMAMPPKEKLSDTAVADLSSWIRRGAPWPAEAAPKSVAPARPAMDFDKARREHWAFQPLHGVTAPEVKDKAWAKSPIDAFVLQKLEANGLRPAPPADKATLLRRIFLDLIGLPPTPEEQKKFLEDSSPDRIEKVIDDLLSRPQYGERWGRHWLDVARFAETQGYERDEPKASAWRYRDYVIKSFNDDKPYDRFVTEQLAGDEIENSTIETQIGTSFFRVGTIDTIAADGKLARYDQLDDILGTTASTFLGQTLRCARCHDHKFEPFAQTDYYKLMCVFEPLKEDVGKDAPVGGEAEKAALREAKAQVDKEIIPIQAQLDELRASVLDRVAEELKKEQETSVDSAGEKKESKDGGKDKKPDANKKDRKPVPPEALAALHKPASERSKQEQDLVNNNHDRIEREARHGADEKEKAEIARVDKQINDLKARPLPGTRAYVFREEGKNPGKGRVFIRGDCHRDGPEVTVGIPTVLGGDSVAPPTPTAATSGRRLWLAKWMTGPGSP
ncbi:MAG: hypothetical protein JWO87_2615, partial [Phycisphaerales bacterium]|nr:hypothetical protein [Phycisphaerales bacterium]